MALSYRELVIQGSEDALRGFLWGFSTAKNIRHGLIFCDDNPINTHHLREILKLHPNYQHVVTRAAYHKSLVAALKATPMAFKIVSDKAVRKASFEFEFETSNKDVARSIKRLLARPPAGSKVVDYKPREIMDPSAKGVELYSPVHDYVFSGKGRIEGNIEKLLEIYKKFSAHEFIETEHIDIKH
jgi:hypothetical protein